MATKNKTSAEQTAEQVKKLLFSGAFKSGDKLPSEVTLAERLQVSRPTLREALRILQASGHVKQIPNRGCFAHITDRTEEKRMQEKQAQSWIKRNGTSLEEFFEARCMLEPYAAAMAATRGNAAAIDTIGRALAAFEADDRQDAARLAKLDNAIHTAIVAAAGNRHLTSFFGELTCFFVQYSAYSFTGEVDIRRTADEHRAVFDAIKAGDAATAKEAMARHLQQARDNVKDGE